MGQRGGERGKLCLGGKNDGLSLIHISEPTRPNNPPPAADNGGFLWGLLGCCIPIAGLILFLIWKDTKPRTAKAAGIGALVCVIAYVLMYVAAAALGISAAVHAY